VSAARKPRSGRPDTGGRNVTYDVRVWKIREVDGKRARTYEVRWQVDGRERSKSLKTRALAEGFRAELLSATRKGTPFDRDSGLPVVMLNDKHSPSWFAHACN
jgi:hypothetical protein